MSTIKNPILRGFNPDPSIIRVEDDYYIATSTFEWFPGVQIHHSKNLCDWQLITRPLDRKSQLDMRGVPDSCGVWAPCLSHHDGIFHLVYSNVKSFDGSWKDTPNFLVTADDIDGPWSDPIKLPAFGFDASLFHEDNGRKWLVCMLVDHRKNKFFGGIVLQEYDRKQKKCVGPVKHIFEGTELGLTEAPHIYQRDGYYYLITAEGGTEYGHAVSFARSTAIDGPYEVHPDNPILTSSGKPELAIQKAGHADIVETPEGELYIVFLCARPLTQLGRCTLGRETSIEKLDWPQGEWPRLENGTRFPRAEFSTELKAEAQQPQTVSMHDFESTEFPLEFQSLRVPIDSSWCSLTDRLGCLRLVGRDSLSSTFDQSLLARRIDSFDIQATTTIDFAPTSFQQMAGLVCYYNTYHWHYLSIGGDESGRKLLQLLTCDRYQTTEVLEQPIDLGSAQCVWLRSEFVEKSLQFSFSTDGQSWLLAGPAVDGSLLSDDYVRDETNRYRPAFTGAFVGICCQDLTGQNLHADFHHFEYLDRS